MILFCRPSGKTPKFPSPELHIDRRPHLDMSNAARLVEHLVDQGLPFQLAGLSLSMN
jgi:hypothetical protein